MFQRFGFDSRRFHIFRQVVGLERGPLSLVSTTEELLQRKISGSGLESREYGRRDPSRWPRGTLYPQKLSLSSPTTCSRSVGIVHSRTQSKEFRFNISQLSQATAPLTYMLNILSLLTVSVIRRWSAKLTTCVRLLSDISIAIYKTLWVSYPVLAKFWSVNLKKGAI
jgi:hypothetical protein